MMRSEAERAHRSPSDGNLMAMPIRAGTWNGLRLESQVAGCGRAAGAG